VNEADDRKRWQLLMTLLAPVYESARATARRLGRSSADGDDLFQEAVLRAFAKLPSLSDQSRFRGWFYAVLLSVHRSRSRRAFWRRFLPLEEAADPPGENGAVQEEERRRAERVSRALATLPAVQREAVVLFELERHSVEEIAEMQKVSVSAVKSRLQRGRARLRRWYKRLGAVRLSGPCGSGRRKPDAIAGSIAEPDPLSQGGASC
jgi:RNA polymerase sigma-70 factor (ECF subfamily)